MQMQKLNVFLTLEQILGFLEDYMTFEGVSPRVDLGLYV